VYHLNSDVMINAKTRKLMEATNAPQMPIVYKKQNL